MEGFICQHPAVADAKLVAMPDPFYGEKGCVFIIPRPGMTVPDVKELGAFLVGLGLAKYKCPERIEVIDSYPLTRVGKLDKPALKKRIADLLAAEASDPNHRDLTSRQETSTMKIAVIGAGPAGMYFSLLAKKHDPSHEIHIHEQNPEGATYGWGVVFSDIGLAFLKEADPEFFAEFTAHHESATTWRWCTAAPMCRSTATTSRAPHASTCSLPCSAPARGWGAHRVWASHRGRGGPAREVDLVIAADGGNSAVRKQFADHFRPSFEKRRNKFAWYGTRQRFHPVSLIFARPSMACSSRTATSTAPS